MAGDPLSECDIYEFECDYSRCIPIEKKCDGYPDCDDDMDEIDCPPFTGNIWLPRSFKIITSFKEKRSPSAPDPCFSLLFICFCKFSVHR